MVVLTVPFVLWTGMSTHPAIRPCGLIMQASGTFTELTDAAAVGQVVILMKRCVRRWHARLLRQADERNAADLGIHDRTSGDDDKGAKLKLPNGPSHDDDNGTSLKLPNGTSDGAYKGAHPELQNETSSDDEKETKLDAQHRTSSDDDEGVNFNFQDATYGNDNERADPKLSGDDDRDF